MAKSTFAWPNGKRIAVAVTAMLETWTEGTVPPYSVQASAHKPGVVDRAGVAWASYGGKVGVYRVINLMRENGIRCTFCVSGRCTEVYPDAVAQIVKSGHDVAGHAYVQDKRMSYMTPDEEKATIKRCLDLLEKATGTRPKGWISPTMQVSEHTLGFLAEAGLLWHGDSRDSDLPGLVETGHGPIVHIPGSDFTDLRVLRSSSLDLWDIYKETFDYLYLRESPAFLVMSLHCHFGGRPMITAIFDKLFRYMAQFPDVWFASYGEIAQWVSDHKLVPDPKRLLTA
jgi:allantoinase